MGFPGGPPQRRLSPQHLDENPSPWGGKQKPKPTQAPERGRTGGTFPGERGGDPTDPPTFDRRRAPSALEWLWFPKTGQKQICSIVSPALGREGTPRCRASSPGRLTWVPGTFRCPSGQIWPNPPRGVPQKILQHSLLQPIEEPGPKPASEGEVCGRNSHATY